MQVDVYMHRYAYGIDTHIQAGGSGLGKSTIITNLLASYWPSPTLSTSNSIVDVNTNTLPSQNHAYTTNSTIDNTTTKGCHGPQHHGLHAGHQQHTLMQQVGVEVYDEEARVVYVLVLQETPPLRGVEDVAGVVHHMKAEAAAHLEAMTRLDMVRCVCCVGGLEMVCCVCCGGVGGPTVGGIGLVVLLYWKVVGLGMWWGYMCMM